MTEGMWGWENGEATESEGGGPCELQRDHCHIHHLYCQIVHVEDSLFFVCIDKVRPSPLGRDALQNHLLFIYFFRHIFLLSLYWIQYISPDMEIRSYSSTNSICKPLSQAWNQSFFNLALSPRLYVSMDASLRVLCEVCVCACRKGGRWVGEWMRAWT